MLVEVLLHQVAERDRAESNFTVGDANDRPDLKTQAARPKKSLSTSGLPERNSNRGLC